jgi:CheY-like chemotaxis protein
VQNSPGRRQSRPARSARSSVEGAGLYHFRGSQWRLEALELLENSEPPSVILLDLNMPVMDGRKFLGHKAENPEIAPIPVIITTGNVEQAPTNLPVLPKPFELQDLLHAVSPYCDTP